MARHKLSKVIDGGLDLLMHDGAFEKKADGTWAGADWSLPMQYAILQELKAINRKLSVLECPNFVAIPKTLRAIQANTRKKKCPVGKPKLRAVA